MFVPIAFTVPLLKSEEHGLSRGPPVIGTVVMPDVMRHIKRGELPVFDYWPNVSGRTRYADAALEDTVDLTEWEAR